MDAAAADDGRRPALLVHAAASLTDALREVAASWRRAGGGEVAFDFGASSTLARQIQAGAPGDVFFSADEARIDALEARGLLQPGTRRRLLSNTLVVMVPKDAPPVDLASVGSLALADPRHVPAGIYARRWLEDIGLWDRLASRIVPADNVRAALAAVESGNADAAIVYRTDAAVARRARIAFEVPAAEGPPIAYAAAVLRHSRAPVEAARFLDFLQSDSAQRCFARHGFRPAPQP
jgi:molybdate transport system substrate-binding protein